MRNSFLSSSAIWTFERVAFLTTGGTRRGQSCGGGMRGQHCTNICGTLYRIKGNCANEHWGGDNSTQAPTSQSLGFWCGRDDYKAPCTSHHRVWEAQQAIPGATRIPAGQRQGEGADLLRPANPRSGGHWAFLKVEEMSSCNCVVSKAGSITLIQILKKKISRHPAD